MSNMSHISIASLNTPVEMSPKLSSFPSRWLFPNLTFGSVIQAAIIGLITGDRIVSVRWFFDKGGSASPLSMRLVTQNGTAGDTDRDVLSDVTSGSGVVSITRVINYTLAEGDAAFLYVNAGSVNHQFHHVMLVYDHP